ncbi:hypothetical protein BKA83DRAFT_4122757 [Pisolithus microcarpus]|nr:hypothetical protein BKA83DRAFT_4122757 [Pisolithus microcarpus]
MTMQLPLGISGLAFSHMTTQLPLDVSDLRPSVRSHDHTIVAEVLQLASVHLLSHVYLSMCLSSLAVWLSSYLEAKGFSTRSGQRYCNMVLAMPVSPSLTQCWLSKCGVGLSNGSRGVILSYESSTTGMGVIDTQMILG